MNTRARFWIYLGMDLFISIIIALFSVLLWNLESPQPLTRDWIRTRLIWVPALSAATIVTFGLAGLYMVSNPANLRSSFYQIARGLAVFLGLYYTIYFFTPRGYLPRVIVLFYILLSFPVFVTARRLMLWVTEQEMLSRDVILLGRPSSLSKLQELLTENTMTGIRFAGLYPVAGNHEQTTGLKPNQNDHEFQVLDPQKSLFRYARGINASGIVLFHEAGGFSDTILDQLVECHRKGITVVSGLRLFEELSGRFPLEFAREEPERAFSSHEDQRFLYKIIKRITDVVGALLGLLLFLPLLPVLAAAIKIDTAGPVFFQQKRTGLHGNPFELVKLRTMVKDAEQGAGAQWAKENDPRITTVGRFLRLTHLDEFPQFWNVLKGDMSLVGPRPERPEIEEELSNPNPFFKLRHSVKPGVTGWATIQNQYVDSVEKAERRLEYDLYYIENQSIWLDLHILFETFWELVTLGGR